MDRGLAVVLTAAVGGILALQAPINAQLGRATGSIAAALVSFTIGTIALAVVVAAAGDAGGIKASFDVEWYYLIGGLLGAVYVTTALITVKTIGAGGVAAATITGQLVASIAIDRVGAFGLEETPITAERLIGVALLLVGTYLIVR